MTEAQLIRTGWDWWDNDPTIAQSITTFFAPMLSFCEPNSQRTEDTAARLWLGGIYPSYAKPFRTIEDLKAG